VSETSDAMEPTDRVAFIRDEPAAVDSFGSHTRVASAISRLITEDPQIKVIGILGPWGSGKSTVVCAVEKQLRKKSKKVHFFTYDAWLHQSDPVRRSFLESLVSFLAQNKRVDESKWRNKLEDLNGSVEKTETETTPVLTQSGSLLLASLAAVPLGVALIGYDAVKDAFATPPSTWAGRSLIVGLILSLAPAIATLTLYLCWRPWGAKVFTRTFWTQHREPHQNESILGILSDRTVDRVLSVTARRPEPTSIEFQQIFRKLMNEAVDDGHSFVFVIDNLDRLAEREALQIWSAVRAFFLGSSDTPVAKTTSYLPTVILPVDANSIRRMFAVEHGDDDAADLSRAFMDKTFDITFEVPEPVMSDWQEYLSKQLRASFGRHVTASDIYWASRFLDDKRRAKDRLVTTPRSINKFVNFIAALYSQRASGDIEIATIAYYAAFAHLIKDSLLDFVQQGGTSSYPPASNWQVQLAGIHYGAPLTKARQILLSDPIRDSLADLDHESFKELVEIPGFGTELQRVLANSPLDEGSGGVQFGFITNAALMLDADIKSDEHWLAQSWSVVADQYVRSSVPSSIPADLDARMAIVLKNAPSASRLSVIDASAVKISALLQHATVTRESTEPVLSAADGLVRQASAWRMDLPKFELSLEAPSFLTLLSRAATTPNVWQALRSDHKLADLASVLAQRLRHATEHATVGTCIWIIMNDNFKGVAEGSAEDWNPIVGTADELLRNQNGSSPNVGSAALALGLLQRTVAQAAQTLKTLIDEGQISTRLDEAASGKNTQMLASGYALLICRGNDFGSPAGTSWPTFLQAFPSVPREVGSRIMEFFGPVIAPTVWGALERAPTARSLVTAVIDDLVSNTGLGSLHVDKAVSDIGVFLKPLTLSQQRNFVLRLMTYEGFWDQLSGIEDDSTFLQLARLLKGTAESRNTLVGIVQRRLAGTDSAGWAAAIDKGSSLYDLATEFSGELEAWPLNSGIYMGLNAYTAQLVSADDRHIAKRWFSLCAQLTDAAQKKAVTALADRVSEGGFVGDLLSLLKASQGKLLEAGVFKPAAAIRSVIVPLLETRPGRKWVMNNAQKFEPAVSKAPRDAVAVLRSELDRLARSPSKWRREDATRLRSIFNMK
jgi:hypothetical protein